MTDDLDPWLFDKYAKVPLSNAASTDHRDLHALASFTPNRSIISD